MTCYQRHLRPLFEALGLPYDAANRARVDTALRDLFGLEPSTHCPEVWAAVKALAPDEREDLPGRIAERLGDAPVADGERA